jgi:hypothetical protein
MRCQPCDVELPYNAMFCPHCGQGLVKDDSRAAPDGPSAEHSPGTAPAHTGDTSTLQMHPGSFMLPAKFKASLEAGAKPEVIIWNLYRHKSEMRRLLESIVISWPQGASNDTAAEARRFLQTHCIVCGEQTELFDEGHTPTCAVCKGR